MGDATAAHAPAAAREVLRTTGRELAALAAGLCQDAGIDLVVAPGGWSWDPVSRTIRVSAEGLAQNGPEYCAGIVAHEVGHFYISRYTSFPVVFPSVPSAWSLLNAIEDPRVDRWICRRYPGAVGWQAHAKVDELPTSARMPTFLRFCLECAAEGDREWRPSVQPPAEGDPLPAEVIAALAATREVRRAYAEHHPPTDPDEPVPAELSARWRAEVWPLARMTRWAPRRREQRVQLSAFDALNLAMEGVFPAAAALWLADRDRVACFLAAHPAHAGAGRRHLEEGRPEQIVGAAMAAPAEVRPAPPWATELATQLLDGAVTGRVRAPLLGPARPADRGGSGTPWRLGPRLPRWRPATDYDRAYAEVADQIEELVRHLEEILRPRRRMQARAGYPSGRSIDLRRAMTFEADPRRYDELWVRASIPDRREAVFSLLVDLSGSMQGAKAHAALLGTILLAETLHRLEVPFAIDGFQDVLVPLSDFREPFGPAVRRRIAEMVQEVDGCRQGGNNCPRYNDDGPCLLEHATKLLAQPGTDRVLVVVSDGIPEGRRSEPSDLHAAVTQLREQSEELRLVALGLGPHTGHVRKFYPESMADVPLAKFARTIGALVERLLLGER
jgi:hypothetical protein